MVVSLFGLALTASAAEWRSTGGSRFLFETTFEGATLPGEFQTFDVRLDFDEEAPNDGTLEVTVDLAAADLGDPDMNEVLSDAAWFDIASNSKSVFTSEIIHGSSPGAYVATGILRLKGIQRTVRVPFKWRRTGPEAATASMQGRFSLQRTDFGVGTGEWSTDDTIGLDVGLEFDVKLERNE